MQNMEEKNGIRNPQMNWNKQQWKGEKQMHLQQILHGFMS
jgi:hypothetical protein